jgi:hypothetical protein
MPPRRKHYVYAVFYQPLAVNSPYVIMAQKNLIGYKGDRGKQDKPMAWNYGGQWNLPGGEAKLDITSNQNLLTDVKREIQEELGPVVKEIVDNISSGCISYRRFSKNAFGVVYFCVPDAYVLQDIINESIVKERSPHDEIYTTEVFFQQEAISLVKKNLDLCEMPGALRDQYEKATSYVDVKERVDEQFNRQRDWFVEALNAIPDSGLVVSEADSIKIYSKEQEISSSKLSWRSNKK